MYSQLELLDLVIFQLLNSHNPLHKSHPCLLDIQLYKPQCGSSKSPICVPDTHMHSRPHGSEGGAKYGTKEVGEWIVDFIRKA